MQDAGAVTARFCSVLAAELWVAGHVQFKQHTLVHGTKLQRHGVLVQIGVFQVVHLGASAEQAYQRVQPLQPFVPFRDASCGPPSFNLSVQHCIQVV